LVNI